MEEIYNNIKKKIDTNKVYLYRNYKIVAEGRGLSDIQYQLKENFNKPSKNIKVYLISFYMNKTMKDPFIVGCTQYTITKDLELKFTDDDFIKKILYSREYLKNEDFKLNDINKIIKALKNEWITKRINIKVYINDVNKAIKKN